MKLLRRARWMAHSAWHTRPRQLLHRLRLTVKRRVLSRVRGAGAARTLAAPAPQRSDRPPLPLLDPRRDRVRREAGRTLVCFLNQERELRLPMDWSSWDWERDRHLAAMNLHYMEFLEALDGAEVGPVVLDWVRANPPFRRRYWLDGWSAYSLSIRCVVWMQQLAARPDAFGREALDAILRSLASQIRFLERNLELDLGGNHLVKNIKALLWAGRFFRGEEARRWTERGVSLLAREIAEQVLPDGMHFERSPAYHCQVFADLLECRAVLEPGELRDALGDALDRMAQATADLAHPDGAVSLMNDGGLGMAYSPAQCLRAHAALGGSRPAPRPAFALPHAGYFGFRAGGTFFLADCGPIAPDHLPAHGHGDILAFEWTLEGQRLVVDAGVYEYAAGEWRDLSRSTRSHNTVTVGDADQCEFWGQFRVARRARATLRRFVADGEALELEGEHDGYARLPGALVHERRFRVTARRVEVRDRVRGGRAQPVRARLLLHPDCRVSPANGGLDLECNGVRAVLRSTAGITIGDAHWFPDFGVRRPTKQIVLEYGPAPAEGGFVLETPPEG